ncbi:hypothetical protein [Rhodococcus jostii]|uniref:Uncharacterized protein n=1 Tax=Rhodococcus jostii TaxID=132919 RepID=A0A1H4S4S8_RHOJO|nr:hypothetical protein [Rhodococcus jostii]SEC39215.1 hypothetical protein SAMN04490220_1517 [Rhodococcus jostii]
MNVADLVRGWGATRPQQQEIVRGNPTAIGTRSVDAPASIDIRVESLQA